jgi:hypothetical protein
LVVFLQVSAFLSCWAVRWLATCAELFARILHAPDAVLAVANTLRPAGHRLPPHDKAVDNRTRHRAGALASR